MGDRRAAVIDAHAGAFHEVRQEIGAEAGPGEHDPAAQRAGFQIAVVCLRLVEHEAQPVGLALLERCPGGVVEDEVEVVPLRIDAQPDPGAIRRVLRGEAAIADAGIDPDLPAADLRVGRHAVVPAEGRRGEGAHRKNAEQAKSSEHVPLPFGIEPLSLGRRGSRTERYSRPGRIEKAGIS